MEKRRQPEYLTHANCGGHLVPTNIKWNWQTGFEIEFHCEKCNIWLTTKRKG